MVMKSRKKKEWKKGGQMKIQQMSFMLIAVVIFFVLVGMVILVIRFSGLKESATELQEKNAILLVTKIANSPEFSCEEAFGTRKTDCIDMDKVMMLKENIEKYANFWGASNIEIRRIYPANQGVECNVNNYPNCDTIKLIDKGVSGYDVSNFVALCRKEKQGNKCDLGIISISYEEVE